MPLSDDDVREILSIVDESELDELRIETENFALHVRRSGGTPLEAAPPRAAAPQHGAAVTQAIDVDGTVTIDAPMLGTFYRAEAPGADPFVELGAHVNRESTVCIIEVMKMMNAIQAGVSGTIVEICAENGELVEYGRPLYRLRSE
jgi:acetyl-CoA carboxylase biotin carboxyl carrier protein